MDEEHQTGKATALCLMPDLEVDNIFKISSLDTDSEGICRMEVNCNKSSGLIEYVLRGVGLVHDEGRPLGVLLGVLTGVFDQQVAVVQELHLQHLEQHHLVYMFISFATQRSVLSRFFRFMLVSL